MRNRTLSALVSSLFALALLLLSHSRVYGQSITPLLQAKVGSGANTSYFVLDFNSGPSPQSFAFAYNYDGAKTGGDLLDALIANVPGFSATFQTFTFNGVAERFANSFTYNGETMASSGSAFWGYWNSTDGTNWAFAANGADITPLQNGSWDGWSYEVGGATLAPRTPLASTAAPEPGTLALALLGGSGLVGGIAVRRRKA